MFFNYVVASDGSGPPTSPWFPRAVAWYRNARAGSTRRMTLSRPDSRSCTADAVSRSSYQGKFGYVACAGNCVERRDRSCLRRVASQESSAQDNTLQCSADVETAGYQEYAEPVVLGVSACGAQAARLLPSLLCARYVCGVYCDLYFP